MVALEQNLSSVVNQSFTEYVKMTGSSYLDQISHGEGTMVVTLALVLTYKKQIYTVH